MDAQKELIAEFDREIAKTRKMLEAIPANADFNFQPHPKSMSLARLAGHLSDFVGDWAHSTLTKDKIEFNPESDYKPFVPANKAEALEKFDKQLGDVRAALAATKGEAWDRNWQLIFKGKAWIDEPKYQVFRDAVMNHMIHHRGQLSVYLRLLGAKVPGIYGPSADEM
ncbi:MAG: DinB family protein [Terracidiphilus sp.]